MTMQEAMDELMQTNHFVERGKAAIMIDKFKNHRSRLFKPDKKFTTLPFEAPSLPHCVTFNKTAIASLIQMPDSVAVRIYPAINQDQRLTFVIIAVNETGENIFLSNETAGEGDLVLAAANTGLLDEGQASPPYPAPGLEL